MHISTVGWGESTPVFLHLASSRSKCSESRACFTAVTWSSDTYVTCQPLCGDLFLYLCFALLCGMSHRQSLWPAHSSNPLPDSQRTGSVAQKRRSLFVDIVSLSRSLSSSTQSRKRSLFALPCSGAWGGAVLPPRHHFGVMGLAVLYQEI